MSFQWIDYLNVAKHLVEHSNASGYSEAFQRAAISRAYYAALITARNLLRDQWGIEVPETAEIHVFISKWFLNEDDENQQEIGLVLDRLRARRRKADYDDDPPKISSLAEKSLSDAQLVIDHILSL